MRKTCLDCVYELAKQDERIVFIGSDNGANTLDEFKKEMPDRFFMEGISEAHVVGMAAGMALEGKIVYIGRSPKCTPSRGSGCNRSRWRTRPSCSSAAPPG